MISVTRKRPKVFKVSDIPVSVDRISNKLREETKEDKYNYLRRLKAAKKDSVIGNALDMYAKRNKMKTSQTKKPTRQKDPRLPKDQPILRTYMLQGRAPGKSIKKRKK